MGKKQENIYLFNQYTRKGIEITKSAIKQILLLISRDEKNKGIKLSIKKSGCAGFRYTMKLINNKNSSLREDDISFIYKNILIQASKKDMPFLDGIKIDFIQHNIDKIFKFYNPILQNICGCGESFSIN